MRGSNCGGVLIPTVTKLDSTGTLSESVEMNGIGGTHAYIDLQGRFEGSKYSS